MRFFKSTLGKELVCCVEIIYIQFSDPLRVAVLLEAELPGKLDDRFCVLSYDLRIKGCIFHVLPFNYIA